MMSGIGQVWTRGPKASQETENCGQHNHWAIEAYKIYLIYNLI